jgi:hypothetical protein
VGHGFLLGKAIFDQVNPRLSLSVEADGGQRCSLGMHRVLAQPAPGTPSRAARDLPGSEGSGYSELSSLFATARSLSLRR